MNNFPFDCYACTYLGFPWFANVPCHCASIDIYLHRHLIHVRFSVSYSETHVTNVHSLSRFRYPHTSHHITSPHHTYTHTHLRLNFKLYNVLLLVAVAFVIVDCDYITYMCVMVLRGHTTHTTIPAIRSVVHVQTNPYNVWVCVYVSVLFWRTLQTERSSTNI